MMIQLDLNLYQLSSYEGKKKKHWYCIFRKGHLHIKEREKKKHLSLYLEGIVLPVSYTTQGHVGFLLPVLLAGMYRSGAAGSL